ncbi:DNA-3-methyladenine glycosylase family protein [Sporolactobacillus putidus]|uniref:DNA-3-methyladenine glycosylase II n=1 Tax=Sporolactobacillus putidus TaxID=492735 RepID=A0A917S1V2_9BACL|nr:DNA-3-methyladenine glycosylase [Sporolactobacillus putidus]GGL51341.1 DNA-3-methyladenine glycosylase [Sporolactobacillus putidus]
MNRIDHESSIELRLPEPFSFTECLVYLGRSDQEMLHRIKEGYLYKLVKIDESLILFQLGFKQNSIYVEFPISPPPPDTREKVAAYVWEWFDLEQDLNPFYAMAGKDKVLRPLIRRYCGLRVMGIPDLFEALTWAIIGQQINLTFAYTLKERLIEQFGESLTFEGDTFWLFPSYEKIASLDVEDLKKLQFSARKAEYVIGVARVMTNGELTKEALLQKDYDQIQASLMAIRGVGAWTADYVLMRCLHHSAAFPIADIGLHHALKLQLGLERKPTIEEIKDIARSWNGWQAYATFYLWRSLYESTI